MELRPEQFNSTAEYVHAMYEQRLGDAKASHRQRMKAAKTPAEKVTARQLYDLRKRQALASTYTAICGKGLPPNEDFSHGWEDRLIADVEKFLQRK